MRVLAFVIGIALVVAACGDDGGDGAAPDEPPSTVPAQVLEVDGHDLEMRNMAVGDNAREYWLFRPTTLDPAVPAPLVVSLHGLSGSASTVTRLGFNDVAEREGIVVAYTNSIDGAWDLEGATDVELVDALIDQVSSLTAIDPNRVYAIGYSMGGGMSTLLACRLPDRITAVATVGMLNHHGPPACPTPRAARVLAILGELDRTYSIEDGLRDPAGTGCCDIPPSDEPPGPLAEEAGAWATTNGCGLDYEEQSVADGVVRREYPCESGSALVIYIHAGGHNWDIWPIEAPDTNDVIWDFLDRYTAPLDRAPPAG